MEAVDLQVRSMNTLEAHADLQAFVDKILSACGESVIDLTDEDEGDWPYAGV